MLIQSFLLPSLITLQDLSFISLWKAQICLPQSSILISWKHDTVFPPEQYHSQKMICLKPPNILNANVGHLPSNVFWLTGTASLLITFLHELPISLDDLTDHLILCLKCNNRLQTGSNWLLYGTTIELVLVFTASLVSLMYECQSIKWNKVIHNLQDTRLNFTTFKQKTMTRPHNLMFRTELFIVREMPCSKFR